MKSTDFFQAGFKADFDVFETPIVGINLIKERLAIQESEKLVSAKVEPEKVETEIKLNMPLFDM